MRNSKGFTLVELMIVVAIVAILVALAVPAYTGYAERARRADAKKSLIALGLAQGKYRAANTEYGTLAQIGVSATSPKGYYDILITLVDATKATAFEATATPDPDGAQSGDSCGTFTITQAGPDPAQEKCWDR